jgi:hypothetical protein
MAYITDPRVDAYIDALPDWQQAICSEVRDLVHGADGEVTETKQIIANSRAGGWRKLKRES